MSVARSIAKRIQHMAKGRPFMGSLFAQAGSRAAVSKALSRLVKVGSLERVVRGVYMRPKASPYIGMVRASPLAVMNVITKASGESVQLHGAEAVRFMGLSSQMQILSTFYTSGRTRQIQVGNATIRLQHASKDRFQHIGTKVGVALTALHYVGKDKLCFEIASQIQKALSDEEFKVLLACKMPKWMRIALNPWIERASGADYICRKYKS